VTGSVITYDNGNEVFSVQGASSAPGAGGSGRVRVVITPKPEAAAAPASEPQR
jgi:lipopolysaccharide export system protein LptA